MTPFLSRIVSGIHSVSPQGSPPGPGLNRRAFAADPRSLNTLRGQPSPGGPGAMPLPGMPPGAPSGGGIEGPNPFQGNLNPGNFAHPAAFNPLLALTRLGARGGMQPPMMTRGPMGSFGLAPEQQRPNRRNPFSR